MLVLSRKIGEQIVIGDGIVVTVTRLGNNRVTLGIDAPDSVRVLRSELSATAKPRVVNGERPGAAEPASRELCASHA